MCQFQNKPFVQEPSRQHILAAFVLCVWAFKGKLSAELTDAQRDEQGKESSLSGCVWKEIRKEKCKL